MLLILKAVWVCLAQLTGSFRSACLMMLQVLFDIAGQQWVLHS